MLAYIYFAYINAQNIQRAVISYLYKKETAKCIFITSSLSVC